MFYLITKFKDCYYGNHHILDIFILNSKLLTFLKLKTQLKLFKSVIIFSFF